MFCLLHIVNILLFLTFNSFKTYKVIILPDWRFKGKLIEQLKKLLTWLNKELKIGRPFDSSFYEFKFTNIFVQFLFRSSLNFDHHWWSICCKFVQKEKQNHIYSRELLNKLLTISIIFLQTSLFDKKY